jgi:hypothetical protein
MLYLQLVNPAINKESLPPTHNPRSKRLAPQLNQMPSKTKRGTWTNETLEVTMDVVERGTHYLRRANRSWNIPMNSLVDHLNGESKSKWGQ